MKENMNNKVCLITGGTNGTGKATAQAPAQMGAGKTSQVELIP